MFQPVKKHNEYSGNRAGVPGTGSTNSVPILFGAALIAVAILLRCQAPERGKAHCDAAEIATGSIAERSRRDR